MLSPNAKMPCFVHPRCSSKEGCPESVPFQESTIGLSHPNCSKCSYNEGTCLNCILFNTGECPIPRRCKSCEFYLKRYDYGYCEYTKNAVLPNFFCAGYKHKETP